MDLRCGGRLHGRVDEEAGTLEVKCDRRGCGHEPGTVVLHTFDLGNGFLIGTRIFKDPAKEGRVNVPTGKHAAVRPA
jgi:hypothetical protein